MKNKGNRQDVDKLFVLGAGASYSATRGKKDLPKKPGNIPPTQTPLDKNFTSILLNEKSHRHAEWVDDSVDKIKKYWYKHHLAFGDIGLEEAIQIHAANMKFMTEIYRRRKKKRLLSFDKYMLHLVHLIAFRLKKARDRRMKIYGNFADEFFQYPDTKNRVITFNYDTVLDNHLLGRLRHKPERVYFSKIISETEGEEICLTPDDSPLILKLHGSINWDCKTSDFSKIIKQDFKSAELDKGKNDFILTKLQLHKGSPLEPDGGSAPCIIPPIEDKPITEVRLFRDLWSCASEYLHTCKELYVCGYSLPDTDALASSLFKTFYNDELEKVTVIDPDSSIIGKWRNLLQRRDVKIKRWAYYSDFAEFLADKNR